MAHHTPEDTPQLTDEQLELITSMFDMARQGRREELLRLIDQGIPADLANGNGDTLLILATYNDHADLVDGLLKRGADVGRLNDRGQSALTCAVFLQNEETTRLLLDAGADPQHPGQNAYDAVAMFGLERMQALMDDHRSA